MYWSGRYFIMSLMCCVNNVLVSAPLCRIIPVFMTLLFTHEAFVYISSANISYRTYEFFSHIDSFVHGFAYQTIIDVLQSVKKKETVVVCSRLRYNSKHEESLQGIANQLPSFDIPFG